MPERAAGRGALPEGVVVRGGRLVADVPTRLIEGGRLAPGVIDLHTHGGGGVDFLGASPEELTRLARWLAGRGTTGWLATYATASEEELTASLVALRAARERDAVVGATCLGVHLEGPFLSPAKAGAQRREYLRAPDASLAGRLVAAAEGVGAVLVTLAPELPGASEVIRVVHEAGGMVNLGHSEADHEIAIRLFRELGVGVTHLWNAMEPMHHRRPGLVAAALRESPRVELIADGAHLHPAMLGLGLEVLGERAVVVSDGHPLTGLPPGTYRHWDADFEVGDEAEGILCQGTLGGSSLAPAGFRRVLHELGLGWPRVADLMSTWPARQLGLERERGRLVAGARADLVAYDEAGEVESVWLGGEAPPRSSSTQ